MATASDTTRTPGAHQAQAARHEAWSVERDALRAESLRLSRELPHDQIAAAESDGGCIKLAEAADA